MSRIKEYILDRKLELPLVNRKFLLVLLVNRMFLLVLFVNRKFLLSRAGVGVT